MFSKPFLWIYNLAPTLKPARASHAVELPNGKSLPFPADCLNPGFDYLDKQDPHSPENKA